MELREAKAEAGARGKEAEEAKAKAEQIEKGLEVQAPPAAGSRTRKFFLFFFFSE